MLGLHHYNAPKLESWQNQTALRHRESQLCPCSENQRFWGRYISGRCAGRGVAVRRDVDSSLSGARQDRLRDAPCSHPPSPPLVICPLCSSLGRAFGLVQKPTLCR